MDRFNWTFDWSLSQNSSKEEPKKKLIETVSVKSYIWSLKVWCLRRTKTKTGCSTSNSITRWCRLHNSFIVFSKKLLSPKFICAVLSINTFSHYKTCLLKSDIKFIVVVRFFIVYIINTTLAKGTNSRCPNVSKCQKSSLFRCWSEAKDPRRNSPSVPEETDHSAGGRQLGHGMPPRSTPNARNHLVQERQGDDWEKADFHSVRIQMVYKVFWDW